MDLMRIIRSFEEFIYEVMTWLLFYPRTLFRILINPVNTLDYAIDQQSDAPEEQYSDTLSPPLFLMLTVVLCYILERTAHLAPSATTGLAGQLMKSTQGTLATRSLLYAIFPLVFAAEYVRLKGLPLTRQTLRPAFFSQCFAAGGFVLMVATGVIVLRLHSPPAIGASIMSAGAVWYLAANAFWFRRSFGLSSLRAVLLALRGFMLATAIISAVALAITMSSLN
ncbi:MAG: hypothetical protein JNK30_07355 [Phenylobacterium sp.]|uniref:hypothetical protein n=1 Tax=Phenylobacterium sp. TaxID=1871053 RepID=UPI001A584F77|nr:hypothetical protein [Phenylobacterium sp.]MBL8771184.1 hypothetical protein [Phenylobacterium sp.]